MNSNEKAFSLMILGLSAILVISLFRSTMTENQAIILLLLVGVADVIGFMYLMRHDDYDFY
jgi:hypothetical protein